MHFMAYEEGFGYDNPEMGQVFARWAQIDKNLDCWEKYARIKQWSANNPDELLLWNNIFD